MEKVVQPQRVVCTRAGLTTLLAGAGILFVLGLAAWVVEVAVTGFAVQDFRDLVFSDATRSQRPGLPIFRVFAHEDVVEVLTPVQGTDVDPR